MKRSPVEGLVAELLAGYGPTDDAGPGSSRRLHAGFQRLAGLDYCGQLRKRFEAPALDELIYLARKEVWPHLNRGQMRPRPVKFLAGLSSDLGVDLLAYPEGGPVGLGVRGFYLNAENRPQKRPLIYINTAHDQGARAATFCHEIGHHLGTEIFGAHRAANLFFYTGYEDHLRDPVELAADALVSLASYPQAVARKVFGDPQKDPLPASWQELTDVILKRVLAHIHSISGLDVGRVALTEQRIQYLAGVIHFAKLRWALLAEYRI